MLPVLSDFYQFCLLLSSSSSQYFRCYHHFRSYYSRLSIPSPFSSFIIIFLIPIRPRLRLVSYTFILIHFVLTFFFQNFPIYFHLLSASPPPLNNENVTFNAVHLRKRWLRFQSEYNISLIFNSMFISHKYINWEINQLNNKMRRPLSLKKKKNHVQYIR